jgi:hypothetical protein
MKLNEKRIELLKNSKVIIHNQNLKKDSKLLNQIISKCLTKISYLSGSNKYYGIVDIRPNIYHWFTYENLDWEFYKHKNVEIKPISWFFEEEINNNIILLL